MKIGDLYDIEEIVKQVNVFLHIDGKDQTEPDFDVVIRRVRMRFNQHYGLGLTPGQKLTDDDLEMGTSANNIQFIIQTAQDFVDKFSGYNMYVRYSGYVKVRPGNISCMGFDENDFLKLMKSLTRVQTYPESWGELIKTKLPAVSNKLEKKLIIIMLVCDNLGLNEIVASIAEIMYYGGKV